MCDFLQHYRNNYVFLDVLLRRTWSHSVDSLANLVTRHPEWCLNMYVLFMVLLILLLLFLHASLALLTFICTIEQLRTYNFLAIQADVACFLLRAYDDNQNWLPSIKMKQENLLICFVMAINNVIIYTFLLGRKVITSEVAVFVVNMCQPFFFYWQCHCFWALLLSHRFMFVFFLFFAGFISDTEVRQLHWSSGWEPQVSDRYVLRCPAVYLWICTVVGILA